MTKTELQKAVKIAVSNAELNDANIDIFNGFGLHGFGRIICTTKALARLIRWQCLQFDGSLNQEALNEISRIGRHKFVVVDL